MNNFVPRFLPAELVLGVPELDGQHEALFAQLVFLKNLCLKEKHLPAAEADALLKALRDHYDSEERLADEMGEDFSDHARQHEVMLLAVAKTLKEVVEKRANVFALLRYLDYWFERHIVEEDRVFDRRCAVQPRVAGKEPAMACREEGLAA
ncbi:MAG TPA: hemerythrin domain-containing protein [Rhodocyclaceae bacterium]|nr:hemerythrin domain-containing protein [Rhodocyclaceae bacterium]